MEPFIGGLAHVDGVLANANFEVPQSKQMIKPISVNGKIFPVRLRLRGI